MTRDDTRVIIEYFDGKFATDLENIDTIITSKVRTIVKEEVAQELDPVRADIKIIKTVITATDQDILKLQHDVADLQAA